MKKSLEQVKKCLLFLLLINLRLGKKNIIKLFFLRQFFYVTLFRVFQYWLFHELQNFFKFICCCKKFMAFPSRFSFFVGQKFICTLMFRENFSMFCNINFVFSSFYDKTKYLMCRRRASISKVIKKENQ